MKVVRFINVRLFVLREIFRFWKIFESSYWNVWTIIRGRRISCTVTPWHLFVVCDSEKLTLSDRSDGHKFPWRRHFSSDSDYLFTGRRAYDGRAATVCPCAHGPASPTLSPWLIIMQAWRQRVRWYYWNIIYEAEIKFNVPGAVSPKNESSQERSNVLSVAANASWEFNIFYSWNTVLEFTRILSLINCVHVARCFYFQYYLKFCAQIRKLLTFD